MTKGVLIIEFKNCAKLILSIQILDYKKKVKLNKIFNLVIFYRSFSIIDLLNIQKQYEIVPILGTYFMN
jgi:hypothetical protein